VGGYPAKGGRRTRWRTLLRTDALDVIPAESQETLRELGLRTVIDLRWPYELVEAPSVFATQAGVRYRSIPLLEDDPTPVIGLAATYRLMLDQRAPQLADVARALLEPGGLPAVIGCAAGKDRTGVTIALLLSAVGVPADVIVADYVLTGAAFAEPDPDDPHFVDWRATPVELECPPEYMEAMLEHLAVRHGGAGALLRRNGLAPADLDLLVDRLTEPAPAP
jgi:protein-tyrosine phosphatase